MKQSKNNDFFNPDEHREMWNKAFGKRPNSFNKREGIDKINFGNLLKQPK